MRKRNTGDGESDSDDVVAVVKGCAELLFSIIDAAFVIFSSDILL